MCAKIKNKNKNPLSARYIFCISLWVQIALCSSIESINSSASVASSINLIWKSYNVLYRLTVTYKNMQRS